MLTAKKKKKAFTNFLSFSSFDYLEIKKVLINKQIDKKKKEFFINH